MKIDLVITELDEGGAERCLANLAIYLHSRNHLVRVIALGPEPPLHRSGLADLLRRNGVALTFLGGFSALQLISVRRKLRKLASADPPDLVQAFLFHANVLAAIVYHGLHVPLVGGVRVIEPRMWRHWLDRWAVRRMQAVVCVSDAVATWCQQTEKLPPTKLFVIPNGVQIDSTLQSFKGERQAFDDSARPVLLNPFSIPVSARLLLFVGRLELQKGIDALVHRANDLLSQLPRHHLVILGEGPLEASLKKEIHSLRLTERVHMVGWQPNPRAWMRQAELLLLPARYEGMPNVILEAMAEGLPVVCTKVAGVQTLLGSETPKQTVPVGAYEAFVNRVVALSGNKEERHRLANLNFRRCSDHFRLEDQMAMYEQLYKGIFL